MRFASWMLSSLRRKEGSHHQGLLRVDKDWCWWTKLSWWTFYWWKLSQPIPSSRANPKLSSLKWSVWTKSLMPSIPPSSSSGTNIMWTWQRNFKSEISDYSNDVHMLKIWTNIIGLFILKIKEKPFSEVFSLPPLSFSQPPDVESGTKFWLNHLKLTQLQTIMVILKIPQHSSCPGFHEPRSFPPRPCAPQTGGGSNIQRRLEPATYCPTV